MESIAKRSLVATDAFPITPGSGPLTRKPTLGLYIPASVSSATNVVVKFNGGPDRTFSVLGPYELRICPSHVISGPAGIMGLT